VLPNFSLSLSFSNRLDSSHWLGDVSHAALPSAPPVVATAAAMILERMLS
jgi:hypothetical protein